MAPTRTLAYCAPLLLLFVAACATNYTPIQQLAVCDGASCQEDLSSIDNVLFARNVHAFFGFSEDRPDGSPVRLKFCEGDPQTRLCKDDGLSIFVLGGPIIPGKLNVKGLQVSNFVRDGSTLKMRADPKSTYVGVPPACESTTLSVDVLPENQVKIDFASLYCNWLVIGNVLVRAKFSLGFIDYKNVVAGGNYELRVNGTANGAGAGYFIMWPEA